MNVVSCISGGRREGKTRELLELCISMMKIDRTKPRFYIVTVEDSAKSILDLLISKLEFKGYSEKDVSRMMDNNLAGVVKIDPGYEENELYRELDKMVSTQDCEVFIDMPEMHDKNFSRNINTFVDHYPNHAVDNSIDIYWTRSRHHLK